MALRGAPVKGLSADNNSAVAKVLSEQLRFTQVEALDETQFGLTEAAASNNNEQQFVHLVQTALTQSRNEAQLQNSILNAMSKFLPDITVPDECKRVGSMYAFLQQFIGAIPENWFEFRERNTRNMLDLIWKKYIYQPAWLDSTVPKFRAGSGAQGLFGKTTSRPDCVAVIASARDPSNGNVTENDIMFAEIKNDEKYHGEDALNQEVCYLMLLLYWYKSVLGLDVKKVRGFFVCGPRCQHTKGRKRERQGEENYRNNRYEVGLIELHAVESVGALHVAKTFTKIYPCENTTGLLHLCRFLNGSDGWNKIRECNPIPNPFPALFCAPPDFLSQVGAMDGCHVVPGGTMAVVLSCLGAKSVNEAIRLTRSGLITRAKQKWGKFLEDPKNATKRFYFKVVTAATTGIFYKRTLLTDLETLVGDLAFTYPINAISWKDDVYAVLMMDRGKHLCDVIPTGKLIAGDELIKKFKVLWEDTTWIQKETDYVHGDIGEHNLLHDGERDKYCLIDWDEAAITPHSRSTINDDERMRHPEVLRFDHLLYTEVQLALLYFRLKCQYCDGNKWDPSTAKLDDADTGDEDTLGKYRMLLNTEVAIQKAEKKAIKTAAEAVVQRAKAQLNFD
mmetsp:Transcript_8001/g.17841  ORF Transcript_8001/g.17841 Transcript_8001/m.17841 type:complete len:619 (-) Transcript_8001:251-2107(-)